MPAKHLWSPSRERAAASAMADFMRVASSASGLNLASFRDLHAWSVEEREAFWSLLWDYCGVVGEKGERVIANGDKMPGAMFFPDANINFAENLLKKTGPSEAMVFRGEDKVERRVSWDELHALVSRLQQLFVSLGVARGDRVAAMMPNMPEAIAAMLAAASLGAVWSSCSPDFGDQGVLDRFGQIEPVLFITVDGYWYNGKEIDVSAKMAAVADKAAQPSQGTDRRLSRQGGRGGREIAQGAGPGAGFGALRGQAGQLRAAALCPSALHPVFVGHDGHPEMHRAFRRRHAAEACQRTAPALQYSRRGAAVLLHHLRLDDVELAGLGAGERRDAAAL